MLLRTSEEDARALLYVLSVNRELLCEERFVSEEQGKRREEQKKREKKAAGASQ